MSIAIAHKDYDVRGGGEVLVERLADRLDAPLYVGRRNAKTEPDNPEIDIREINLSRLDKWLIDANGLKRTLAYMTRWQAAGKELQDYDTVITSGNEPLWYVPPDDQTVIAYTHSTPRFMYDLYTETLDMDAVLWRLRVLFKTAQRTVYESNVHRPDLWVCNSDSVARRVNRYWNIPKDQIRVVYPPVDVENYSPDDATTQDFYLHVGRIAGHKRVESLVDQWKFVDTPLKIAGTGPEKDRLEEKAPDNVTFLGYVSEERKQELMSAAKAHVYPCQNEDFGMVPIESMAAGTPMIGVDEGFTKHQIMEGKTGYTYSFGTLPMAIHGFEKWGVEWSQDEIAAFSDKFSVANFEQGMRNAISDAEDYAEVNPEWSD